MLEHVEKCIPKGRLVSRKAFSTLIVLNVRIVCCFKNTRVPRDKVTEGRDISTVSVPMSNTRIVVRLTKWS